MSDALLAPFRAYSRSIGSTPYAEVPFLGAASGLAGYYGGGALSDRFIDAIADRTEGADPERVARTKQYTRAGLGGLAALLAGLYAYRKHAQTPEDHAAAAQKRIDSVPLADWGSPASSYPFSFGRGKEASASDPFARNIIPVNQTLDTLHADPYLNLDQKQLVSGLVGYAPKDTYNNTSGRGIVRTALGLGVDFGAAYLVGRVFTGLAGLPAAQAKQISIAGGLANALYNTGIFSKGAK